MTTLIIAATEPELSLLAERLQARRADMLLDFPVYKASDSRLDALLVTSGPGMANAAAAAGAAIMRNRVTRIYNTGICGVFSDDTSLLGRAVIGQSAIFADTGAAGHGGFQPLDAINLCLAHKDGRDIHNHIPLDSTAAFRDILRADFLTVATVTGTGKKADELRCRFKPDTDTLLCEDMESAAVALVALRAGIPCTVVRGISNLCGERDRSRWNIAGAARAAQETLFRMLLKNGQAA